MIGLLQRVSSARVDIGGAKVDAIGPGLVVLVGVERNDDTPQADRLLERLLGYRVFPDSAGKMNHSVKDIGGGLLLVPQFTLAADTEKGMRPSFAPAAAPEISQRLFDYLVQQAKARHPTMAAGVFGANMQVTLVNDGPVTFWLEARPRTG